MTTHTLERRTITEPVELRAEGDKKVASGYAAVFNKLSQNMGGFVERVAPGAFTKTLQEQDIRGLFNHEPSAVLGRNIADTLRLSEDGTGLTYELDLPDTTVGRDVAELLARGDVSGSSFGFRVIEDEWGETEDGFPLRTLKQVSLRDVGPVTFPAYTDSSSALRSLAEKRSLDLDDLVAAANNGTLKTLISGQRSDDDLGAPDEIHAPQRARIAGLYS